LERREEFVIETSRFRSFDFGAYISCHSEIGVLIYSTGNETRYVFITKEVRKTAREARSCLNCRVGGLSTVIRKL